MIVNQKPSGTSKSVPLGIALGWLAEILTAMAMCALLTVLVLNEKIKWSSIGYGVMVILLTTSCLGAAISCKLIVRRKMMMCTLSGVTYIFALLLCNLLFFDGKIGTIWLPAILIIAGAATAAVLHSTGGTRRRKRVKRKR